MAPRKSVKAKKLSTPKTVQQKTRDDLVRTGGLDLLGLLGF